MHLNISMEHHLVRGQACLEVSQYVYDSVIPQLCAVCNRFGKVYIRLHFDARAYTFSGWALSHYNTQCATKYES